MQLYQLNKT